MADTGRLHRKLEAMKSLVKKMSRYIYGVLIVFVVSSFLFLTTRVHLTDIVEVSADDNSSVPDGGGNTVEPDVMTQRSVQWKEQVNISHVKEVTGQLQPGERFHYYQLFRSTKCPVLTFKTNNITPNTNNLGGQTLRIKKPWTSKNDSDTKLSLDRVLDLPIPETFHPDFVNPCWYDQNKIIPKRLRCLPYFFLAGFPKSGTTDLFFKLGFHPQVQLADVKEPHWWTRTRFAGILCDTQKCQEKTPMYFRYYVSKFSKATSCMSAISATKPTLPLNIITGEASASTFWDNHAWQQLPGNEGAAEPRVLIAHHIRYYLPNSRIVVILRNPVDRVFSDYLYFWKGATSPSGEDLHSKAMEFVKNMTDCFNTKGVRFCSYSNILKLRLHVGLYSVYMKDWLSVFPSNQIHALRTEDYSKDPVQELNKIYTFLGLNELPKQIADEFQELPKANTRRKDKQTVKMLEKTKTLLTEFYEPFNQELAHLLNDDRFLWQDDVDQTPTER